MTANAIPPGLTTNRAPFIEHAQSQGEIFIKRPYELYSQENHEAWRRLFARIRPRWEMYATSQFMEGVSKLALDPHAVPRLADVNGFLHPLSGFSARPISGYVPAYLFFDCLRTRAFPTTITKRKRGGFEVVSDDETGLVTSLLISPVSSPSIQ